MYKDKNILVCGIARSGIAVARLVKKMGGNVTLQDMKQRENISEADELEKEGFSLYLGDNPDDIVSKQDLIIISPGIPVYLPFIAKSESLGIPVISEVELAFRHTPCPVVAITGTNGKTTTTTMVGEIMQEFFGNVEVVGNIGVSYSGVVDKLVENQWVVAEISSFQMEKADTFYPKICAVLNIAPDHLNRHKTMENYIAMKERVFQNQTENDFTILNFDDKVCRAMADKTKGKVVFFSSREKLDSGIYIEDNAIKFNYNGINETVINIDELQILGRHNHENIMATVGIVAMAGVDFETIRKVLRKFMGVEHRIEYVNTVKDVVYYNDSKATNVDAGICGISAMNRPTILIGGGSEKGEDFTNWIKSFDDKVKHFILIGETATQIKECANANGFDDITMSNSMEEAVELAHSMAEKGYAVLLSPACASFDMFQNYEKRGEYFKECVNKLA